MVSVLLHVIKIVLLLLSSNTLEKLVQFDKKGKNQSHEEPEVSVDGFLRNNGINFVTQN